MHLLKNIKLKSLSSSVRFFSQQFTEKDFYLAKNYIGEDEIRLQNSSAIVKLRKAELKLHNARKSPMRYLDGTVAVLEKRREDAYANYLNKFEDGEEKLDTSIRIGENGEFQTPSTSLSDDYLQAIQDLSAVKGSLLTRMLSLFPPRNQWEEKYKTAESEYKTAELNQKRSGHKDRPSKFFDASLIKTARSDTDHDKHTETPTIN